MYLDVIAVQIALALVLFLLLNWMGRHAEGSGYVSIGIFMQRDEAPAFNLMFRIFGTIVYTILVSSALYFGGLDNYVDQIWRVVLFYYFGRLLYIAAFHQWLLVNWGREAFLWITSIGLAWASYVYMISKKGTLLPDAGHFTSELWVLIALFVYSTLNNIRFSQEATKRRKNRYLYVAYSDNRLQYQQEIEKLVPDRLAESIVYSILIYENFNRPPLIRAVERVLFPFLPRKTLGLMQVVTDRRISDIESLGLGARRISNAYTEACSEGERREELKGAKFDPRQNENHRGFLVSKVAAAYNKDDSYVSEIRELHQIIVQEFYKDAVSPPVRYSDTLL